MQFALSEEQQELAQAVRHLVERRAATMDVRSAADSPRGYDKALWEILCTQIGVAALAIPEEYGGAGFSSFETHVVLEELGKTLTPSPLFGSAVVAAQAVLAAASPQECARLLPGIAAGTVVAALCWADEGMQWRTDGSDVRARSDTDATGGWLLTGSSTLVLHGATADLLLVVATTPHGPGLFEVSVGASGLTRTPTPAMDPTLQLAAVQFESAPARVLGLDVGTALERVHAIAATAVTALQVGGTQRALDLTVAYLQQRVQFGRKLGSYQALKHRVADVLVGLETARSMSWAAGWSATQPDPDPRQASIAKAWCSDAFSHAASEMVQLHGGIAITWEHDAHLYFKRAHATAQLFGAPHEHRRRLLTTRDRPTR